MIGSSPGIVKEDPKMAQMMISASTDPSLTVLKTET